jgi:hypothetical protein
MSRKFIDLTGQRFGNLIVESYFGKNSRGQSLWNCRCDCGKLIIVNSSDLKKVNGQKTCGDTKNCKYAFDYRSSFNFKHGLINTKEYKLTENILIRCYNKDDPHYPDWGGRGIIVHQSWINDRGLWCNYLKYNMGETWQQFEARTGEQATLDRIDVNGNYEPGNIRWATQQDQQQNRTNNVFTEALVKLTLWKFKIDNWTITNIYNMLIKNFNFQGSYSAVLNVTSGVTWSNITIDKELTEYNQFGTINGIKIVTNFP